MNNTFPGGGAEKPRSGITPIPEQSVDSPQIIVGDRVEGIVFGSQEKNGVYKSISSDRSRKVMILDTNSIIPTPGQKYTVIILQDTEPTKRIGGKYLVTIAAEQKALSLQDWQAAEKEVDLAEPHYRRMRKATQAIYSETGIPANPFLDARALNKTRGRLEYSLEEMNEKAKSNRVLRRALKEESTQKQKVDLILKGENSSERELVAFKQREVTKALRTKNAIDKKRDALIQELADIRKKFLGEAPTFIQVETMDEIRAELDQLDTDETDLIESSPEAYYSLHLQELRTYRKDLKKGRIVETPYVHAQAMDIVAHLQAGDPTLIYGHLGSGKSELAMHVARTYLKKEPLIISGSKHTSLSELYGNKVLDVSEGMDEDMKQSFIEIDKIYTAELERVRVSLASLNEEERKKESLRIYERVLQLYIAKNQRGTVSRFVFGPIFKAMEEGRPVIIDEVNAIPHEVLISLNHFLTRRPGEKITIQQDGGREITVADGFCILMTANLNQGSERYVNRSELDPAFTSRLHNFEYEYLPQSVVGTVDQAEKGDELYHILLARSLDEQGNLVLPDGAVPKLWNLAKAARVLQDVFSGKDVKNNYFRQGEQPATRYTLKKCVLSLRAMDKIIRHWQTDGYTYELDWYVWNEFLKESTDPTDTAFVYQQLKSFGFFSSDGWPAKPDYGSDGIVVSFKINPPKNMAGQKIFHGPRAVVDMAFGKGKSPKRKVWPIQPEKKEDTVGDTPDTQGVQEAIIEKKTEKSECISEDEAVPRLEQFRNRGASDATIAKCLVGMDSDRAWRLRDKIIAAGKMGMGNIIEGLAGVDSDRAWKLRDEYAAKPGGTMGQEYLLKSLAGLDSDRAWKLRDSFISTKGIDPRYILKSLVGIDSERAWKIRNKYRRDHRYLSDLLENIAGLDSAEAWKLRKDLIGTVSGTYRTKSTMGLDSERAWEDFRGKGASTSVDGLLQSIVGIDSERAWKIRDDCFNSPLNKEKKVFHQDLAYSLAGLDSDRAWEMRSKLNIAGMSLDNQAISINGDWMSGICWRIGQSPRAPSPSPVVSAPVVPPPIPSIPNQRPVFETKPSFPTW